MAVRALRTPIQSRCKPFLKWVGGKTQLLPELLARIPEYSGRYIEPFLGGGALFFAVQPKRALLCDANGELINAYLMVRDNLPALMKELRKYRYDREFYYSIRNADRLPLFKSWSPLRRAARFIYLNKTCYNGLYRVNSRGEHNVPFGRYSNPTILDAETLTACSRALQNAELRHTDFRMIPAEIRSHDFVYFDPPYVPLSSTSSFTSYQGGGFTLEAQEELARACEALAQRGTRILLSNSATPVVRKLFHRFKIETVRATRAVNSDASKRGGVREYLVSNWPDEARHRPSRRVRALARTEPTKRLQRA